MIRRIFRAGSTPALPILVCVLATLANVAFTVAPTRASGLVPERGNLLMMLDGESSFAEGCFFGLCLCPIALTDDLKGRFRLAKLTDDDGFRVYYVENVEWTVNMNGQARRFTGSGIYRIRLSGSDATQQLSLHLADDQGLVEEFESGIVPVEAKFPEISIGVVTPEEGCFGQSFEINARPARLHPSLLAPAVTPRGFGKDGVQSWGTVKARWDYRD